jgi:hypothetical protein
MKVLPKELCERNGENVKRLGEVKRWCQIFVEAGFSPRNRLEIWLRRSEPPSVVLATMLLACFLPFALTACGAYFVKEANTASLLPQPSSVSFGAVSVGQTAQANISLINQGTAPIEISELNLTGKSFSVDGPSSLPITIAAGNSYILSVHFNPVATGTTTGLLTVSSNSAVSPTASISLNGTGTTSSTAAPSELSLSCSSTLITGPGSDSCTVTLNASAPNGGLSVNLSSNSAAVAVPATLMVPANTTSAVFSASVSSVSTVQTATLTASTGSLSSSFALQLNAATATLTISANNLVFGNTAVNATATQSLTLTSTGTAPVTINSAALSGAGFKISGATYPVTLNPGQAMTLNVQFNPTAAGAVTGQLTLTSNASTGGTSVINLTGTGTPVLNAISLSCRSASMTGSGTDSCTVTLNSAAPSGGLSVNLSSSNAVVTVPPTLTVPANATNAEFTAMVSSVSTVQTATLTASTGSLSSSFALQLNAATATLTVSTNSLVFGNTAVNATATQSLTLTSTGAVPVTISGVTLIGAGFTVSGINFPVTLNPGHAAILNIGFAPTGIGPVSGQLSISSNSSTSGTALISLSGTGTAAPAALSALFCSSGAMTGSGTDACTVTLSTSAPSGGLNVSLSSSSSAVTVPSTVTVPAGAASAGFTASVSSVATAQVVRMTASTSGMFTSFTLQLNAAILALSINATSVAFGDVMVNTPATQSITLTSTGSVPVTVNGATLTGAGFTMSGVDFPATLSPNQEATLNLEFDPTTPGAATGQLTIASNSSTDPTAVISLSGNSQPAITLKLSSSMISTGATLTGTITLGQASANDVTVNLTSLSTEYVTVTPAILIVPAGQTTATFSFTGVAVGVSTLSASAIGYGPGSAQVTATIPAIPATLFGLTVLNFENLAPSMSFGTTRSWDAWPDFDWSDVNPSPGVYNFTYLDQFIAINQARGTDIIYTLNRTPQWASSQPNAISIYGPGQCAPPADMTYYDNYLTAIATHVAGKIKYWELWNEPNYGLSYCGDVSTMVTMAQHASRIIKGIDPSALILSPSPVGSSGPAWLASFLAAGGSQYVDIIALHGYWSAQAEDVVSVISNFRTAMNANGAANKPMWDTESSWSGSGNLPTPTMSAQVGFIAKDYILHWSQGVSRFVWYAYDGGPIWGGLWNSTTGESAAAVSYSQTYKWLVGATLTAPCSESGIGVWTCTLSRPGGYAGEAVWISNSTASLTVPAQYTVYRNLSGEVHPITNHTIMVGDQPILLETTDPPT